MVRKKVQIFDLILLAMICPCCYCAQEGRNRVLDGSLPDVTHSQNTSAVPGYEVFELTFKHENKYENPFFDVTIDVIFTSPSKKQIRVGGFHYGSSTGPIIHTRKVQTGRGERQQITYDFDKQDLWKARFAPSEVGRWKYSFIFKNVNGQKTSGKGGFLCVKGRRPNKGFIRLHPTNPFRFVFDDGSPYFPIGLQDCWGDNSGTGSVLDQCSMEGPFRTDLKDPPPLPPGPMFVRGPSTNPQNADVYFRHFSQCGFNLYRFSQQNCSYSLYRDLDHYLVQEGVMTDELLCCARKYGFGIFYGIFGFGKVFNDEPHNQAAMSKVKRFIKYSVDRWGAYVDFWEFLNEQNADDRWYEIMIPYLKSIDPYHHLITTSWERPKLPGIEINAPHWYQRENELESDAVTASRAKNWKKYNKPVIVGEQGNHINKQKPQPPGVGGVWDNRSAVRMRIRNWTALFHEIAFIFWNTSYARDGHFMNIWLGPKEREYVRAMQDFVYRLDKDIRMADIKVSHPDDVRAYGLASKERAGVYLHHFSDHAKAIKGVKVHLDVPKNAKGYWYSPENAAILGSFDAPAGPGAFEAPEFTVDLALLITPNGPPDIDKDGIPNHLDPDDDEDGVPDKKDAFPLDPEEWLDKDKDWIGDNLDADDDGDGVGDDKNKNGIPDCEELDLDGDGVDRAKSVPWDVFPLNPKESRDTDGDGIGDNADLDDDNDGWSDKEEKEQGTNPLDKLSFPTLGLASLYPGDEGIERDPRVLFVDDFETGTPEDIGARWGSISKRDNIKLSEDIHTISPGNRSIHISKNGHIFTHTRGVDTMYARFYVKFHERTGYIHHFVHLVADRTPTPWPKGGAGETPPGDAKFSTGIEPTGQWGKFPPPGIWNFYTYWHEMKTKWGSVFIGKEDLIQPGRWYCVEVMLKANSSPDKSDGEQAFWVDGKLFGRFTGFRWRTTDKLKINSFWLLFYNTDQPARHNKDPHPESRVMEVWFDDIVIATEYIGPVYGKPKNGKKIAKPSKSALLTPGLLLPEPGEVVFSKSFDDGAGNFKGGSVSNGGIGDSKAYVFGPKGAWIWDTYSIPVMDSTTIRFKLKPLCDVSEVIVMVWSKKHKDNCRYRIGGLSKNQWRNIEFRAIEARVGWDMKGPSLEADVLDNIKLFFEGSEQDKLLLDDFEILK